MKVKIEIRTSAQMKKLFSELLRKYNFVPKHEFKRQYWRMPYVTHGYVQVLGENYQEPIYITIQNISEAGIGFIAKEKLNPTQKVNVVLETNEGEIEIPATIVHCTESVGMYKIGARFDLIDPESN